MADQSASPLFTLPAELRNQIWSYCLIQPTTRRTSPSFSTKHHHHSNTISTSTHHRRFCANILLTCHHAHREGLPILYGENTFSAHSSLLATLPSFLLLIHPKPQPLPPVKHAHLTRLIRHYHLHLRLDTDPQFTRVQVDASFTGVEELEIEVFQAMYGSSDFGVLELFEGVRGVGRAVVRGSVGDGRYADWLARSMMSKVGVEVRGFEEGYVVGGDRAWDAWSNGNR